MEPESVESGSLSQCKLCRGITLDSLSVPGGYKHARTRTRLMRSARGCRLCSNLFRKDRSREDSQLWLKLERYSDVDPQLCLKIAHANEGSTRNYRIAFSIFTNEGDPAASRGIIAQRKLFNTSSPESFVVASKWIQDCMNNHDCSTHLPLTAEESSVAYWPSRLVDLKAFDEPSLDVRLVDNDGEHDKYATLSHCWGRSRDCITTLETLDTRKNRIFHSNLPKTFKDAVSITRSLGIRFLWIDALCIIQDSRADWEKESARMGAIYSMSHITIAADSGVDCHSGCFNTSSTTQAGSQDNATFELCSEAENGEQSCVYLWDPSGSGVRSAASQEIDGSPLAQRGWVCQERILSPRILHYTRAQLFWECRKLLLAEDGLRPWSTWTGEHSAATVPGLARHLYRISTDQSSRDVLLGIWYNHVVAQSYSRRKLTLADDKLTAISGVARAFYQHLQCKYMAGIWLHDIAWGLSWRRKGSVIHPPGYRSPSFSWAAVDAIVEWPSRQRFSGNGISIEEAHIDLDGRDSFGRVSDVWIRVTGQMRKGFIEAKKRMSRGSVSATWELRSTANKWIGAAFLDSDEVKEDSEPVEYILLDHEANSNHSEVLLLQRRTPDKEEFVRVGVAEIHGYEARDSSFDDCPLRTITIF